MNKIDPQYVVDFLNEIHKLDSTVLQQLIDHRVECNEQLANHPTVQVGTYFKPNTDKSFTAVGFLGLLNGLVGIRDYGVGYIAAVYDDDDKLTGFRLTDEKLQDEFEKAVQSEQPSI